MDESRIAEAANLLTDGRLAEVLDRLDRGEVTVDEWRAAVERATGARPERVM